VQGRERTYEYEHISLPYQRTSIVSHHKITRQTKKNNETNEKK